MIGAWAVYVLLVSALVSVAAWLAERGAGAQRWPTRWVWASAPLVSIGVPLAAWLLPATSNGPAIVAVPGAYVMSALPPLAMGAERATISTAALLLSAWAVASACLLVGLVVVVVRLARRRRRWSRRTVDGVEVLVSRRTGPAALGVLRGRVVLPEWALSLEATQRRLLVMHEAEHVRAGDPRLALFGLLLCALVPWNLPLWWQLRRLRLAIEVDCDARVLSRTRDARGYGSLLLEVGQRRTRLALALAEPRTMLERRIRMITTTTRKATLRATGLAVVAGLLLAVACETPVPTEAGARDRQQLDVGPVVRSLEDAECRPAVYLDGEASSMAALEALEPSEIESVNVLKGVAVEALRDGAGSEAEAAGSCGAILVITKSATAEQRDRARRLLEQGVKARGEPKVRTAEAVREGPAFTPMTQRPRLRNKRAALKLLLDNYPPLLRDAGIGGTANVWFFIDEAGTVRDTRLNTGSGHEALDQAALRVARLMEFEPARNGEDPVPVWVALDLDFEVR